MNKNPSHIEAKCFLEEYLNEITLDFKKVEEQLNIISKENLSHNNFTGTSSVLFFEGSNFELISTIKENNICLNKSRFSCLHKLNIDCHHVFHKAWISAFYRTTKDKPSKSHEEQLLIEYLSNHLNWLNSNTRLKLGSIRTTPYEFLDAIYHEGQHLCQNDYIKRLFDGLESPPSKPRKIILLFVSIYDFLLKALKNNNIEIPFSIETISTPSEIDARHTAMTELNQIRKSYFKHNNMFCLHFIDTNIIPKNFDPAKSSLKMFEHYNTLYNLYINAEFANSKLTHIHNFLTSHKEQIVENFKQQFETMIKIVEISIERLDAINKSDIIY